MSHARHRSFVAAVALAIAMVADAGAFHAASAQEVETHPPPPQNTVRIGSWNIANLHAVEGMKPEGREAFSQSRDSSDYMWLAETARAIGFDLLALQEIHSVEAVRRVFPADKYDLCFEDGRKAKDQTIPVEKRDSIYTAVAIRKDTFSSSTCFEMAELAIEHTDPDGITRLVRGGTGANVMRGRVTLKFMSVHLKSSCSAKTDRIDPPSSRDCATLGKQLPIMNAWIDTSYAGSPTVVVAGDYNRVFGDDEQAWPRIDDRKPEELDLFRVPFGSDFDDDHRCVDRPRQIDYIIFPREVFNGDGETIDYVQGSFRRAKIPGANKREREKLSDHCPIWGDFLWPKNN